MMVPKKVNDNLSTTFNLGVVYANLSEDDWHGEITKAGFSKEMRESRKTGRRAELDIFNVWVKFLTETGMPTFLIYKPVVSQAENSRFIQLLKEFNISFDDDGQIDVSKMIGQKVIATIKNSEDQMGMKYSNIHSLKKVD